MFEWSPGLELRQARRKSGFSQADLSELTGLTVKTVRNVERSEGTVASLLQVANALKCELRVRANNNNSDFGQVLSEQRKAIGLSLDDAAVSIGVSLPTIISLEKRMSGRTDTLCRYVSLLGCRSRFTQSERIVKHPGRSIVPRTNQPSKDLVMTPRALARMIVEFFELKGPFLDLARGQGAFFDAFPAHEERYWAELSQGVDFMDWDVPVRSCITNPPWSKFLDFMIKATSVADDIVLLCAWSHMGTKARLAAVREHGFGVKTFLMVPEPKGDWPSNGFQLGAFHIQRGWTGPMEIVDRIEAWRHTVVDADVAPQSS